MGSVQQIVKWGALLLLLVAQSGCGGSGSGGGGDWCCSWQTRRSACGGGAPYTAWETRTDSFKASEYYITPQEHCQNMASNDTSCAGSCCINVEGANPTLTSGACH